MNRLQIKKLEVLSDMVVYYSQNPSERRSVNNFESCFYKSRKSTSKGCAIGRHCSNVRLSGINEGGSVTSVYVYDKLPLFLRVLGKEFLSELQLLHDKKEYWSDSSLSFKGFSVLKLIVRQIEVGLI